MGAKLVMKILALFFALFCSVANAQTPTNFQVNTPADPNAVNSAFGSKQDFHGALAIDGTKTVGYVANNLLNLSIGSSNAPASYAPYNGNFFNTQNAAFGYNALGANTETPNNAAFGYNALASLNGTGSVGNETAIGSQALMSDTTGIYNTGVGSNALLRLTIGTGNVSVGHGANGGDDTSPVAMTGSDNVSIGGWANQEGTTANANVFIGMNSGLENATGTANVAIGLGSMQGCASCSDNIPGVTSTSYDVAVGYGALQVDLAGAETGIGYHALNSMTNGQQNTAIGFSALGTSITDSQNTAVGWNALSAVNGSSNNTALGDRAGTAITSGSGNNTIVGSNSGQKVSTGANNVIVGGYAAYNNLTTGSNNVIVGTNAQNVDTPAAGTSNWINLGGGILGNLVAPTISSGFGASPSIVHGTSNFAFQVNVGTGASASSGIIAFATAAPNGWACSAVDGTNPATSNTVALPTSVSTITLQNYSRTSGASTAWAASDIITVSCHGF